MLHLTDGRILGLVHKFSTRQNKPGFIPPQHRVPPKTGRNFQPPERPSQRNAFDIGHFAPPDPDKLRRRSHKVDRALILLSEQTRINTRRTHVLIVEYPDTVFATRWKDSRVTCVDDVFS